MLHTLHVRLYPPRIFALIIVEFGPLHLYQQRKIEEAVRASVETDREISGYKNAR